MKLVILVGSLREGSYNMKLARTIQERYVSKIGSEIAQIGDLPYFDQDSELDPPEVVKAFKKKILEADGVMIVTPEYNWSVPGVLKNALDWLSRVDQVLSGKPVITAGVTPGMMGTIRAQLHLREILAAPGLKARLLPPAGNEVLVNMASSKFDEATGRLTDEATLNFLDEVMGRYMEWVAG